MEKGEKQKYSGSNIHSKRIIQSMFCDAQPFGTLTQKHSSTRKDYTDTTFR